MHRLRPIALITTAAMIFCGGCLSEPRAKAGAVVPRPATYCNPMDLDYRFQLHAPSRREAADPTLVFFKGEYWLFASKCGGYWHSADFLNWSFVQPQGLPIEDYAPAVVESEGRMLYTAFASKAIFATNDLARGVWTKVADIAAYKDPAFFLDDDGRLFLYYGSGLRGLIKVVELDPKNHFRVLHGPVDCLPTDSEHHGFEVSGEENRGYVNLLGKRSNATFTEGAWMTKHAGVYYLQYATPGTQYKTYADGVYTAANPMGPFTFAPYSPFSHKPTGFIGGAGHSSTIRDAQNRYWQVTTMSISARHMFERRLGLFPVWFEKDGQMVCDTYLGDYPRFLPRATDDLRPAGPGWMLLTFRKEAFASSTRPGSSVAHAFDENVRTWWSAATGGAGEWLQVDLGKTCRVDAIQINFADEGATTLGRDADNSYRFYVEASEDGKTWRPCIDQRENPRDNPHSYTQLPTSVPARFLRLVNVRSPANEFFAVSGFRVFGSGLGQAPAQVQNVAARRNPDDPRQVHVSWSPVKGADFHIIRYGVAPDRLFNNYQVYDAGQFDLNSLNAGVPYFLTVDAVNDSGVTPGSTIAHVN